MVVHAHTWWRWVYAVWLCCGAGAAPVRSPRGVPTCLLCRHPRPRASCGGGQHEFAAVGVRVLSTPGDCVWLPRGCGRDSDADGQTRDVGRGSRGGVVPGVVCGAVPAPGAPAIHSAHAATVAGRPFGAARPTLDGALRQVVGVAWPATVCSLVRPRPRVPACDTALRSPRTHPAQAWCTQLCSWTMRRSAPFKRRCRRCTPGVCCAVRWCAFGGASSNGGAGTR